EGVAFPAQAPRPGTGRIRVNDRLTVHFVHPGNPFSSDTDGIVSVQRNFAAAAPELMDFIYWGVGRPDATVGDHDRSAGRTRMRLRAVVSSDTQRPLLPLSLRF